MTVAVAEMSQVESPPARNRGRQLRLWALAVMAAWLISAALTEPSGAGSCAGTAMTVADVALPPVSTPA